MVIISAAVNLLLQRVYQISDGCLLMVVGQLLITLTVEICIQQLGQVEEMVDYRMMRYGILSMR